MSLPSEDAGWVRKDSGRCRSCGAPIVWWITPNQKRSPHDPDGVSHFATCPQAEKHRSPRSTIGDYGEEPGTEAGRHLVGLLDDAFTRLSLKLLSDELRVPRKMLNEWVRKVEQEAQERVPEPAEVS